MKDILIFLVIFFLVPVDEAFSADAPAIEIEMPSTNGSMELSPKVQFETSFRIAARSGRLKDVNRLLDEGVDVNGSGAYGETALMYASRYNFPLSLPGFSVHLKPESLGVTSWFQTLPQTALVS